MRRRLGERAIPARTLSAAVAVFAVGFNWVGHGDHRQGAFFAGMSALGYTVWLVNAEARRRDQLRTDGKLPPTPPAYGTWQRLRHPGITRRARLLFLANPQLGVHGSLAAARAQQRAEQRQAAIAQALRQKVTAAVDPLTARIAVATFDLDEIAARLAASADYDGLTTLIAADLTPHRLTTAAPVPDPADTTDTTGTTRRGRPDTTPTPAPDPDTEQPPAPAQAKPARRRAASAKRQPSAAERVARAVARSPRASDATIAARLGLSEATVKRHRRHAVDSLSPQTPALHAA